jgi:hypothetical protein
MSPLAAVLTVVAPAAVLMFAVLVLAWALTPRRPEPVERRRLVDRRIVRTCRRCGCTDEQACPGGCHWVADDLCSACPPTSTTPGAVVLIEPVRPTLFAVVCTEDGCSHESGGETLIGSLTADTKHWNERHALRKALQP